MPGIKESLLETARTELEGIRNRRYDSARFERIDWPEIEQYLHRLDNALEAGSEYYFHRSLASLQQLLSKQGGELRALFGEEQQSAEHPPPPPVLELINHIVDRLQQPAPPAEQTEARPAPQPKDKQ